MNQDGMTDRKTTPGWHWVAVVVGVAAIGLLAWAFMDFVQHHTRQAERVSRSAGWLGQPVGTMPQAEGTVHTVRHTTSVAQP